jgi:PAS domain S-box-containing protein
MLSYLSQRVADAFPQAVVIVEATGDIALVNQGSEALFGWARAELVGRKVTSLLHAYHGGSISYDIKQPSSSGALTARGTIHGITKQGPPTSALDVWISVIESDEKGRQLWTFSTTASQRSAEALVLSYRMMVELAPTAMILVDPAGRIDLVNSQVELLFGYPRAELHGKPFDHLLPSDLAGQVAADVARLLTDGQEVNVALYNQRGLTKSLASIPLEIRVAPMLTDRGAFVVLEMTDIRDRLTAELRFQQVVEAAPTAMIVIHSDKTIGMVNQRAELLFRYSRAELVGQPINVLFDDAFMAWHDEQIKVLRTSKPLVEPLECVVIGRRKDGSEFHAELGLGPIATASAPGTIASVTDVTERRRQQEELRRSNAELEQFAYIASHDLQEPLRMIASYTQLLARRYEGKLDDKADKYIGYAVGGAKRMQRLIDDLLRYARLRTQTVPFAQIATKDVVDSVLAILNPTLTRVMAVVEVGALPVVLGDEMQLQQLFQNLIANAAKFRSDLPLKIRVDAHREGEVWHFRVQDNGIGIEIKHAAAVFNMFQRLHERGQYEGSGIGLAIARRIVEHHAGRIWIESVFGAGATIHFTLPAISKDVTRAH